MSLSINTSHFKLNANFEKANNHDSKLFLAKFLNKENITPFTGWYDWPKNKGFDLLNEIDQKLSSVKSDYDLILVIGIGGSYLGTRCVADALAPSFPQLKSQYKPIIYLGHDLAESSYTDVLNLLDQHHPIVNVISKSGTTIEPSLAFRFIRQYLQKRYGAKEASARFIATTDAQKGALRQLSNSESYLSFVVPDDVGGRFSVLTAVGLVPLALAGYNIKALMKGADDEFNLINNDPQHPVFTYAKCRHAAFEAGKVIEVMAYSEPKLKYLTGWWQQLFGESEGKQHKGLFPVSLCYSTDLHSMGQFIQDGTRAMIETFLTVENSNREHFRIPSDPTNMDGFEYLAGQTIDSVNKAAMMGTMQAHVEGGVPCLEIKVTRLDEEHLGRLFAFFQTSCSVTCDLLGVNAFDQPGVEAYKKNLFKILKENYEVK